MALPEKFCCCCGLQLGGVVLGWCWSVISIVVLSISAVYMNKMSTAISNSETAFEKIFPSIIYHFLLYFLISSIINLVASIFLLAGAQWKKPMLLVPWLMAEMFLIVTGILATIIGCVVLFTWNYGGIAFLVCLFGFAYNGACIYWWVCMISLYKKWRKEENSVPAVGTFRTPALPEGISLHINHPPCSVYSGLPPSYSLSPGMPPSYSIDVSSEMPHSHDVFSVKQPSHA